MRNDLKNALYGAGGFIFPAIVSLATTPYILHKLTPEIYGIYILCITIMGVMSFLDLGFGQGVIKFVSQYEAVKNYERINRIISTSLVIYIVMGLLGALAIFVFSDIIAIKIFRLGAGQVDTGIISLRIVSIGFLFSFISALFSSIPKAVQRYDIAVKIQNFLWFASVMSSVLLLYFGKGIIEILIAYLLFQFIGIFAYAYASKKLLPEIKFGFKFDKSVFKEIFSFSIFVSLNVVSANIVTRIDKMIVSHFLGTSAVSFYTIPYNLASMISSLVGSTNQFLFPAISSLNSKGEKDKLRHYFIKSLDYTALLSTFLLVIFIIFSDRFIYLWLGEDFAKNSYHIAPLIGFTFFFSCLSSVSLWYYTALNRTHINLISSLVGSSSYLIASLILIPLFGLKGAAFSFMFILVPFPVYNFYICKIVSVRYKEFISIILPYTILTLLSLLYVIFWDGRGLLVDFTFCISLVLIMFVAKKELFLELANKIGELRVKNV